MASFTVDGIQYSRDRDGLLFLNHGSVTVARPFFECFDFQRDMANGRSLMFFSDDLPQTVWRDVARYGVDPDCWEIL